MIDMTTRKSTLGRDEKVALNYARRLGLPVAIALLRRQVDMQRLSGGSFAQDESDDQPEHHQPEDQVDAVHGSGVLTAAHAGQQQRHMTPAASTVRYVTKGAGGT